MNFENLPKAVRAYSKGLTTAISSETVDTNVVSYVFNGLTNADLSYDTSQYPVSGTFSAATPAWLNDLRCVPDDWQWNAVDIATNNARAEQVQVETSYIKKNVPGQEYRGKTTADIIQQWYTQGFWSPDLFPSEQVDALTQNWIKDDAEFARQRLGGANPNVIKIADSNYDIPAWIGTANNAAELGDLRNLLSAAQSKGELFVCDYGTAALGGLLGNVVTNKFVQNDHFLAAPICFFTINTTGDALVPQAIQIEATDPCSYIFTPGDSDDVHGDAWLLAKLWAASADQQWWFGGSHLFNTHSIDMLFGIGALNSISTSLSATHPMVVLAKPFLGKSFSVNNLIISAPSTDNPENEGIYQKGSFCDEVLPTGRIGIYQIINNLYQNYDFDDNAFPTQMTNRGLNTGAMAKVCFPYRDDGQVWWSAIEDFVGAIVDATYEDDSAVKTDIGLNAWLNTVQSAFNHDGVNRFNWKGNETICYAKSVFCNLLYLCSAQHTGVNNTMFASWAFTPNGPFAMQATPPSDAASVSQETVLKSLPNPQDEHQLINVITNQLTFAMSGTSVVGETLGVGDTECAIYKTYPYNKASQPGQYAAVGEFWNRVWNENSVQKAIRKNQSERIKSWTGSTPIPNSLSYYYLGVSLDLGDYMSPEFLNAPAMNSIQV